MDIYHYLIPKSSNNYKARVLHNFPLMIFAMLMFSLHYAVNFLSLPDVRILGYAANIPPEKVIEVTNQKRIENGMNALTYNEALAKAAKMKAQDMLEDDYWAHVAPDGTEPWYFFKTAGYSYRYAGENLARDFSDTNSAIEAWLASPSHRENMLSPKYTEIGVAVVEGDLAGKDTTLIVQLFGTPSGASPTTSIAQAVNEVAPAIVPEAGAEEAIPPVEEEVFLSGGMPVSAPVVQVDDFDVIRTATIAMVSIMIVLLVVDIVIRTRKGVVRVGGRAFAHLSFLGMVAVILLILKGGSII